MTLYRYVWTCATVCVMTDCDRSGRTSSFTDAFARWFIDPAQKATEDLVRAVPRDANWDDLMETVKQAERRPPGSYVEAMNDSDGTEYSVGYATPKVIRADTLYPLIIYLHGGTGGESNGKGDRAYEMLSPVADSVDLFLASPSANRHAPWWCSKGIGRILRTLRFMCLHYPVDPSRVFLAGVSDGATGCYAAANCIPGPFAGFIAISGFGGMLPAIGLPLVPGNLQTRPIYNVNAGKDRLYPAAQVDRFLNWLEDNGVPVERSFHAEEGHGFEYRAREIPALVRIVRSWTRPSRASEFSWTNTPGLPSVTDHILHWEGTAGPQLSTLSGRWRGDTLDFRMRGITSVTMMRNLSQGRTVYIRDGRTTRRMVVSKPDRRSRIQMVLQGGCLSSGSGTGLLQIRP